MSFQCRACGTVVSDSHGTDLCLPCQTQRRQHEQLLNSQMNPRDLFAAHIAGSFAVALLHDEGSKRKLEDPENLKKLPDLIAVYSFIIADAMMRERNK